jgi:hypothetical protein
MRIMRELDSKIESEQERFFESEDFLRRDDSDYPSLCASTTPH